MTRLDVKKALSTALVLGAVFYSAAATAGEGNPVQIAAAEPSKSPADSSKAAKGEEIAVLEVENFGTIKLRFYEDVAPGHVANFKKLVKAGFYDGTAFHRVVPGFMIQGGDPNTKNGEPGTWGQGGPGYTIKAEFNEKPHKRGVLSMARSSDPNSAGSQFFICVADVPFLNRQYTAFGEVIEGMDVVDKIVSTPTMGDPSQEFRDRTASRPKQKVVIKKVTLALWPKP